MCVCVCVFLIKGREFGSVGGMGGKGMLKAGSVSAAKFVDSLEVFGPLFSCFRYNEIEGFMSLLADEAMPRNGRKRKLSAKGAGLRADKKVAPKVEKTKKKGRPPAPKQGEETNGSGV